MFIPLFLWLFVLSGVRGDEVPKPCTGSSGDRYFDLSSLSADKDYVITSPTGTQVTINVCRAVTSELWNPRDVAGSSIGGFFRGEHGDVSIGTYNTSLTIHGDHPYIYMLGGSFCPGAPSLRSSTAIRFTCDPSIFSLGSPQLVAQLPPSGTESCAYFIEWRTSAACPTTIKSGAVGFIGVFFSILLVALLVYIVGGIAYNRYVLGLRGRDMLPALGFVSPGRAVSLGKNVFQTFQDRLDNMRSRRRGYSSGGGQWGSWGRNQRANAYGRLPAEEEQGIMEPRFSLEDEEEEEGPILYNDIDRQKILPPVPQTNGQRSPAPNGMPSPAPQTPTAQTQPASTTTRSNGMDAEGVIRL